MELSNIRESDYWGIVGIFCTGIGAVYTHPVFTAVFEVTWWWKVVVLKSHLSAGIEYTALGQFEKAVSILDPEWLLFIPSMLCFPFFIHMALP
ncbi:hypothetical protein [Bacillus rubiinfantis]|uniref:hypothetical protein n=1 Tax=Bacillus rubiinfantis TaxID=1499680 RepID=UPI0011DC7371|nr:hypothetical protein [Bacillus rubiinfantis]